METNNKSNSPEAPCPVAWIGLDWGDTKHAFALYDGSGHSEGILEHSAENLHRWLEELATRYGSRPVVLAIEASRGAVVHALVQYPWLTIYPINPLTSANFRKAFKPSGAKDDVPDANVLLELARFHTDKLRPLEPQDPVTVELKGLVEARRGIVDQRTAVNNRLTCLLKTYYPQALQLVGKLSTELAVAFLRRWPDLISLKAARPGTIKRFYYRYDVRSAELVKKRLKLIANARALTTDSSRVNVAMLELAQFLDQLEVFRKHIALFDARIKTVFAAHPDAVLFRNLPGAGPQLAPRLCVAFAEHSSPDSDPSSLQKLTGVAPVREKSGNQIWTHWRWQAPNFLRQTFVEWAGQTVLYSSWAKAYYEKMIKKGKRHGAILRALAFKWIRILCKCWKDRQPYDEARYLKQLVHRKSPNAVSTATTVN